VTVPKAAAEVNREAVASAIRDRVIEFRRVPAAELEDNDRNWRLHPYAQKQALSEVLDRVGIAGALTAYYSERNGGKLTLIDGHERRSHEAEWPTLILDVSDEEADLLLLTLDPITGLAEADGDALAALLDGAHTGTLGLEELFRGLTGEAAASLAAEGGSVAGSLEPQPGPVEMELQTFESYDYIVVLFRSSLDWSQAKDKLGLEPEAFTLRDGATKKIGLGRVVEGSRFLEMLK
jgi:hypothetical protein